jgi:hypothetical protein
VGYIRQALTEDPAAVRKAAEPPEPSPKPGKDVKLPISEEQVRERVRAGMERAGYHGAVARRETLPSGEAVWIGESERGKIFSRVITRLPVCDVCHASHFIITFDASGKVVDFDLITLTKYGNAPWALEETAFMRKKLVGLSVLEKHTFDPKVDAVTSATMSSSLIFDSVGRTGKIYEALKKAGYF